MCDICDVVTYVTVVTYVIIVTDSYTHSLLCLNAIHYSVLMPYNNICIQNLNDIHISMISHNIMRKQLHMVY